MFDQLGGTRRLFECCGLTWEGACVDFEQNPAAMVSTSAAQVRQRIYSSSVAQWRHYEAELDRLRRELESASVERSP